MHQRLTDRQEQVLSILTADDAYCTLAMLAEALDVSAKTISRELELLEDYLREVDLGIQKRSGQGLRIVGETAKIEMLCSQLKKRMGGYIGTPRQRQLMLKQELLRSNEPIKLYALTRKLNVVESTISSDLDKLEEWFKQHAIKLVRKQGLGVYLEGEELSRRNALVALLYESIDPQTRYRFIIEEGARSGRESMEEALVLGNLDVEMVSTLVRLLEDIQKKYGIKHEDNAFVSIVLHLIIVALRAEDDEYCSIQELTKKVIRDYLEYPMASDIVREMNERLALSLPEEESCYIAMHLHGSKLTFPTDSLGEGESKTKKLELARRVLELAQQESQYTFRCDDELVENVANHIGPAISRIRMGLTIRNPLEEEIKHNYPALFALARRCAVLIEQFANVVMPDPEVAYLTMYLGAAIEKSGGKQKNTYHVAICCPTGMSTSALLCARIQETFDNVVVDQVVSLKHAQSALDASQLDFVVSTIEFKLGGIDVLSVSPLFPPRDQQVLRDYLKNKTPKQRSILPIEVTGWKDRLTYINKLGEGIVLLLGNFFFEECACKDKNELINLAAAEISAKDQKAIAEAFLLRESLGSVVLEEIGITLLHARTSAVADAYFGILKPDLSCYSGEPITDTVVVMLAQSEAEDAIIDIMRRISVSIASDELFLETLRRGSKEVVYKALERMFKSFFNTECMK